MLQQASHLLMLVGCCKIKPLTDTNMHSLSSGVAVAAVQCRLYNERANYFAPAQFESKQQSISLPTTTNKMMIMMKSAQN